MTRSQKKLIRVSKFLSLVLRHKPEAINLHMDEQGWADIDELIAKSRQSNKVIALDHDLITTVVETNDKRRFALSDDGKRIRANQGHSVKVDLQLTAQQPPNILYHGTASRFLEPIRKEGVKPGVRQYVHLSKDTKTAIQVGQRYGKPVVLTIDAKTMHQQGIQFFQADNGVWLTHHVPPQFISQELS